MDHDAKMEPYPAHRICLETRKKNISVSNDTGRYFSRGSHVMRKRSINQQQVNGLLFVSRRAGYSLTLVLPSFPLLPILPAAAGDFLRIRAAESERTESETPVPRRTISWCFSVTVTNTLALCRRLFGSLASDRRPGARGQTPRTAVPMSKEKRPLIRSLVKPKPNGQCEKGGGIGRQQRDESPWNLPSGVW